MARVPVGRRNLFSERRRAVLAITGVAVTFLMVVLLDGVVGGATRELTRYIDTSPASVFVAQSGVTNMHMASSSIPLSDVRRIRAIAGVVWADPILYAPDELATTTGQELAYVIGYVPGERGGPASLVAGRDPGPGEIVIDRRAASTLGLAVGDPVRLLGRTWRVSGITSGLTNIANTVAFVPFDEFAAAMRLRGTASYVLVGGRVPADALARRIAAATGLSALSRERFSAEELALVQDMSAQLLQIMALAAFLIALAVIGLALYTSTLARLRETGVMKALGARPRRLAEVVLSQALWTVGAALGLAIALALALAWILGRTTGNISVTLNASSIVRVAVTGAFLGAFGSIAPLIRVWRVDPASVFRR